MATFGDTPASDYQPGQLVTWRCEPRGGYGYAYPVDGVVIRATAKRVTIEVSKTSGERVRRTVTAAQLKPRAPAPQQ